MFSLKSYRISRLRKTIRGYIKLKKNKNIYLLRDIKNLLSCHSFKFKKNKISKKFIKNNLYNPEYAVRQFLLERILTSDFNKEILRSIGSNSKVSYPLPSDWVDILINKGFKVNITLSKILWFLFLAKQIARSLYLISDIFYKYFLYSKKLNIKPHSYFYGLKVDNLLNKDYGIDDNDICRWYILWSKRNKNIEVVAHNVHIKEKKFMDISVLFYPPPYYLLKKINSLFEIFFWYLTAFIETLFLLIIGRWWNVILLSESIRAKAVSLTEDEYLPVECLFHFSNSIYRPLWTYELEYKGSKIISYFYSTYEQPLVKNKTYESIKECWGPTTWPLFLVWDWCHYKLLGKLITNKFNALITGPVTLDRGDNNIVVPAQTVAVFDIEEFRISAHFPYSTLAEYVSANPDFSYRFLFDIQQVLSEYNLNMGFKRKRTIGNRGKKNYSYILSKLSKKKNGIVVPSCTSGLQLSMQCCAIIAMPFTSAGLYGLGTDIPSAYYDPFGWIDPGDPAAHGVTVLTNIIELKEWVSKIIFVQ